jgi:hypothetical protein
MEDSMKTLIKLNGWLSATIAIFMAAGHHAPAASNTPAIVIATPQNEFLTKEPIQVRFEYTNSSSVELVLKTARPSQANLRRNGGAPTRCYLFETVAEQVGDIGRSPVKLQPGESHLEIQWLLLGKSNLRDDWEFLTQEPGQYTLSFPELGDKTIQFTVRISERVEDVQSRDLFTLPAAAVFLNEDRRKDKAKGILDLQEICQKVPVSAFAPYAAYGLAARLWKMRGPEFDAAAYNEHVQIIINHHQRHYLREEALYLLAQSFHRQGKRKELGECLDRLSKEYPNSLFINKSERTFGLRRAQTMLPRQPKVARSGVPAQFELSGADRLAEGPRAAFEGYWRYLANNNIEAASQLVHSAYFGDYGSKQGWRQFWDWAWRNNNVLSLGVGIQAVKYVNSYNRPFLPHESERNWHGEMCLIMGEVTYTFVDIWTGIQQTSRSPATITAMLKTNNAWLFVSEYVEPTPNAVAYSLAMDLNRQLTQSPGSVDLINVDGSDIPVSRLILSHVAPEKRSDLKLLSWKLRDLNMIGEQKDRAQLRGVARIVATNKVNKQIEEYPVTISLKLDGQKQRLQVLEVSVPPLVRE